MSAARKRSFAGRSLQIAEFGAALAAEPGSYIVLYLHGPGGIGKSTLLRGFADEAREAGRTTVLIDGGDIELSPTGFETAAAPMLGPVPGVLLVDTFERCQGLEHWLRDRFLPRLPLGSVVVLAGRRPPDPLWALDPAWSEALRVETLGDLSSGEAIELLRLRGVAPTLRTQVLGFAGGHPLALTLAAAVAGRETEVRPEWMPTRDVIAALIEHLIGQVPSALHRLALEVCAYSLTTTEELLRAVVGDRAPEIFAWLRELPFVEADLHGLAPHDLVRGVLIADLRWRDPQALEVMHKQIAGYLLERVLVASGETMKSALRSLYYMLRFDVLNVSGWEQRLAVRGGGEFYSDEYRASDRETVLRLAIQGDGPEAATLVDFWLRRRPETFRIYRRSEDDEPVAFVSRLPLSEENAEEIRADPIVAAAWAQVKTAPLRSTEVVLLHRFTYPMMDARRPIQVINLIARETLEGWVREDRLAWSIVVLPQEAARPVLMEYIDHDPVAGQVSVGKTNYTLYAHDWRSVPVLEWVRRLGGWQLFGPETRPDPSVTKRVVLARAQFDEAIRSALTHWQRPDVLAANPLIHSRMIAANGEAGEAAVPALRARILEAVESLAADPRELKLHRAVTMRYLGPALTQEDAAERLKLPFSTYRRHLNCGIERICDRLWDLDI